MARRERSLQLEEEIDSEALGLLLGGGSPSLVVDPNRNAGPRQRLKSDEVTPGRVDPVSTTRIPKAIRSGPEALYTGYLGRRIFGRGRKRYGNADWEPDACIDPVSGPSTIDPNLSESQVAADDDANTVKVLDFGAAASVSEEVSEREVAAEEDAVVLKRIEPALEAVGRGDHADRETTIDGIHTLTAAMSAPSTTAYDTDTTGQGDPAPVARSSRKHRAFTARLVTKSRRGHKAHRPGIAIIAQRVPLSPPSAAPSLVATQPDVVPLPESFFLRRLQEVVGAETADAVRQAAKAHNTTGDLLPDLMRDFFPALSDRRQAIKLVNELRTSFDVEGVPADPHRLDGVKIHRSLAQMRERLYAEIASALILPDAPAILEGTKEGGEDDQEDKPSMSLTPSSLDTLSRTLPKAFPADRSAIRSIMNGGAEALYGEEGEVMWLGGVGRMKRKLRDGETGVGYRGEEEDGPLHVFVDHSNILYGLTNHLYSDPRPLPPRHQRVLSLPCLHLLLTRGRPCPPGAAHLVASSPLHQDLNGLVRLGWEVSVMKRVEIYEDEVHSVDSVKLAPKPMVRIPTAGSGSGRGEGVNGMGRGLRRFKEQGVDEVLTLKILQLINSRSRSDRLAEDRDDLLNEVIRPHQVDRDADHAAGGRKNGFHPRPSAEHEPVGTIVLATGDARGGQFNKEGFLGAVREAVQRGWIVELWSFSAGLSRAWKETAKKEKWEWRFRIYLMDEFAGELVEVNEDID